MMTESALNQKCLVSTAMRFLRLRVFFTRSLTESSAQWNLEELVSLRQLKDEEDSRLCIKQADRQNSPSRYKPVVPPGSIPLDRYPPSTTYKPALPTCPAHARTPIP
jgi:hypothetical protein